MFYERNVMWKLIVGFIAFAGLAMFVLMRGGEIDMSGEKHGVEVEHAAPAASAASAPAVAPASAPAPVADAASAPAAMPAAPASAAK